jgi:hypothetical protein
MTQTAKLKNKPVEPKVALSVMQQMWEDGRPISEIIFVSGIPRTRLYRIAAEHNWQRSARYAITGMLADDPSEEEIAIRAAEIRASWPEDEAEKRFRGKKREEARIPALSYDVRSGAFVSTSQPW